MDINLFPAMVEAAVAAFLVAFGDVVDALVAPSLVLTAVAFGIGAGAICDSWLAQELQACRREARRARRARRREARPARRRQARRRRREKRRKELEAWVPTMHPPAR